MTTQPEALRLADELDGVVEDGADPDLIYEAAAELRRLHGLDFALRNCEQALKNMATKYMDTVDQRDALLEALRKRDALLEALRKIGRYTGEGPTYTTPWQDIVADLGQTARAAISAVEGEKT